MNIRKSQGYEEKKTDVLCVNVYNKDRQKVFASHVSSTGFKIRLMTAPSRYFTVISTPTG